MSTPRNSFFVARCAIAGVAAWLPTLSAVGGPLPADLVVDQVNADAIVGDELIVNGDVVVTIRNQGETDVVQPIDIVLFEDDTTAPGNSLGQYDSGIDRIFATGVIPGGLSADASTDVLFSLLDEPVLFRDNLIYAVVDPDDVIIESNETNNLNHSAAECLGDADLPTFEPVIAWQWNPPGDPDYAGDPDFIDWANVMVTPAIGDVTGPAGVPDGVPDIVFPSTNDTGGGSDFGGVLRVVDGQTGIEWYSITDPEMRVTASMSPAIGDIDGDGLPEIVCSAFPGQNVRIFEHDGAFKLDSVEANVINGWNAVSLANIDPPGVDPLPEIICRARVINRDGTTRWTGSVGFNNTNTGYGIAYTADYDLDGDIEVVVGDTVYDSAGNIEQSLGVGSHFTAVANFDGDDRAEIVTCGNGQVRLFDDDGTLLWGPIAIPGGGFGGPPTIGDFDNDGAPEVATVGATRYVVVDGTGPGAGTILWERVVSDTSSNRTGSSVFDFEGDGFADVVYRDQTVLYLMDGATGADKSPPISISSCTWTEYVQVADVDADAHAEIIAVANNNCGFGPQRGVFVIENSADDWVNTRRVWNQHAYSITNVNDTLTIPETAEPNWLFPDGDPFNNFRQNLPSSGVSELAQADLTASRLRLTLCENGEGQEVRLRVGNGGADVADVVVDVNIYDVAAGPNAGPVGTVPLTQTLQPGEFVDLDIPLGVPLPLDATLAAAVDAGTAEYGDLQAQADACTADPGSDSVFPDADLTECVECNNIRAAGQVVRTCLADLNCDGVVDQLDLDILLAAWGPCPPGFCIEDINLTGETEVTDLLLLLAAWGRCPAD